MTATVDQFRAATSEAAIMRAIIEVCDQLGILWYHDADSRRNPAGYPDLIIPLRDRVLCLELKTAKGRVRPEQQVWLDALDGKRIRAMVVRPVRIGEAAGLDDVLNVLEQEARYR